MAVTKRFRGFKVETKILDGDSSKPVDHLWPGRAYGHVIEISKFFRLSPFKLSIESSLNDTKQLSFREHASAVEETASWKWKVTLHPNQHGGYKTKLVVCADGRKRDHDAIKVTLTGETIHEHLHLRVEIA
jgi:hypothetical protein